MSGMPDPARSESPGWFRLFPFLRAPDDITPHQWRLLGLLGVTVLINHYDFALLTTALLQIQEGLGVAEADVGHMVGAIRTGAILALPLSVVADRRGGAPAHRHHPGLHLLHGADGARSDAGAVQPPVRRPDLRERGGAAGGGGAEEFGARGSGFAMG
jgi:hypothetical protein